MTQYGSVFAQTNMPSMKAQPLWVSPTSCKTDQNSGIVDSVATLDAQLDTMLNKDKSSRCLLENKGRYKKSFSFSRNKNVCEYCGRRFNEYSNLIKHRRIHTGLKPYKCELCAKDFTQSSNLNVHRKRCKGPDLNQSQFVATAQIKKGSNNWKKLMAKAVPRNLIATSASTENDKRKSDLSQAKNLSLKGISPRFVDHMKNLNICRQLQYQKCLRQENTSVANSKNGSSNVPLNSADLRALNSSETSAESLTGTLFSQNSNNVSNKIMQESGSVMNNLLAKRRTYPCEYCSRRFNESSNLIKHRRIHTGQRPYKCTFCGKDFTQSSNLNVHKKICKSRHFSRTALRLDSSLKPARLPHIKFQNKWAKVPGYGAFENSQVSFSQLSSQDSLPSRVWDGGTGPSQNVASTSSLTNFMSHLSNVTSLSSFSSEETQFSHHKYIPLSSQLQNMRNEHSESIPEERLSKSNSEEIYVATFTDNNNNNNNNNNLRNRKMVHTRNKLYTCEYCQKCFKWLSTLNIHRQSCTKNFIHNVGASSISNDENGPTIEKSTFRSQKLSSFDDVTKSSFVQQEAATNNKSYVDYIVIDDESDDGNDSEIKGNVQQEFEEHDVGTSLHGAGEMNDVKPFFIKCEPGSFPDSESVSTFDNMLLSEVDSKSFLPQIEPFPSAVLEVKQEPIEGEHSTSIDPLSVKQEICDEEYNVSQSITFDPRVNNGSFESELLSIPQNDLRDADQETNNQNLTRDDQNSFLSYKSTLEPDLQNANTFQNSANQNRVVSQSLIRKSFCRLRCHVPPCKSRFFKSLTAYETHMRMHNGQKPYVCEICRKNFNERSNYTKHLRIHSGYKPYKCTLCGHAFTQSSNLNVHRRKCKGQKPYKITSNSVSTSLLRSNELNAELSEYNPHSLNTRSADSLQRLALDPQNNVAYLHASSEYRLDSPLQEQMTVIKDIGHKDSVRNPIISEYSKDDENVTHSAYTLSNQNFAQSDHSVKAKINNSVSKLYKCSFCHRTFIHLTNYSLHQAACKRRSHLMRMRNPSAVADREIINDMHASSKHPSGFSSSSNPDTCMHTSDVDTAQIELDHDQIKSSSYFSTRNNLSLISTSEFLQEDRKLISVGRNFGPSSSLFEPTESKVNLDKMDQNSNNLDPNLLSAPLENNNYQPFEKREDNSNALSNHPELRLSPQIEAIDKINQTPTSSKIDNNCKDLQDKISLKSIADPEKVFQCKLRNCRKVFHLASELKEHTIRHRKGGTNVCKFCHKQFNESSNLIKHKRIHTGVKPYKCEFCNKFFSQSSNRNVHRKSCSKSFACNLVLFSGTSNPAKTPAVVKLNCLECEICQQQFQRVSDLYSHKNSCKLKIDGKARNITENKSEVASNFSAVSLDYQTQRKSPKPIENSKEQSSHFREENMLVSSSPRNPAVSPGSVSPQKQPLNGQYMFQCPFGQCGKIFKMALILRRHIAKDHSKKQQYPCEVCGVMFYSLGHLSQHQQIHSGQKQFSCGSCGKHFIQFSYLNDHRKICNGSSALKNFDHFSEDLAGSNRKNQDELSEKSNSDFNLQITRTIENTSKTSNVETYDHVINIDDNDEDDGLETVQLPTETALNSSVSLNHVKRDIGDKTCEISSNPSPEHVSGTGSVRFDINSQENQIDYADIIMIDQSPDGDLQDGGMNQKESEVKNKLSNMVDSIPEREITGTLLGDSGTVENNSLPLSQATSWIRSSAKSNGIYSTIHQMDTPVSSSKSNPHCPVKKNNNWKPSTVTSFGTLTNNPSARKSLPANASNSHQVFYCQVRSCRKALRSEQEVRMHQCKRRTYPCEYCQRRFNESSNLIKHRRIHTGHKPYKCKFCGKMFTQSSNLNVHRKICARKHNLVEQRFTQPMTQHRNLGSTEFINDSTSSTAVNINFHEIDLSEESIADVFKNKMVEASTYEVDDISDKVEGALSSGENCRTITKVEDFESGKNMGQNSGIIVEDSLTGEVKLQISEKELNAFKHQKILPDTTKLTDSLIEFKNLQDGPQAKYTGNQILDALKKEFDNRQDPDITSSQHETDRLEIANISQIAPNDIYNSTQSIPDLSSQLDIRSNHPLMHKLNTCTTRNLKIGLQFKRHLKRRTYPCEFCKRRFESSNLIKHRRIHLGLRPYKCQHCGRSFTQSSNCNVHKKNCAEKHQLSGPILQDGARFLSDASHIDPSAPQVNDINNDQAGCSDNYVISNFPLSSDHSSAVNVTDSAGYYNIISDVTDSTIDHRTGKLSCNANDDHERKSSVTTSTFSCNANDDEASVNDTRPIFSISSVRSLKENANNDLQFTDTKTEYVDTSYTVQGIKPAPNLSESGNGHVPSSTVKNPPSMLNSEVDAPDENLTISDGFTPASHQKSFTSNAAVANRKHNFKEPFVSCQNQNGFQRKYLQCPFCPRLCKNPTDFQRHIRVHTGHKPYKCKMCNKLFTDYSNLSKHRRVHTGFKPYKCNLCLRQFSQSSNLNVHKKNCKGVQLKNMSTSINLSPPTNQLTSLDNRVILNNPTSQILPTADRVKLKNSSPSFQKDRSFSSGLMVKSELSEGKPQSKNLISKVVTSTNSKLIAQRISMKYLSRIPSRLNRNFSRDFATNSKLQVFGSRDQRFLNAGVHIAEKTSATVPETTTYHPRLNSSGSSLTEANSCLQVKPIDFPDDDPNINSLPNRIMEKKNKNIDNVCNRKSNNQTVSGFHIQQKHYYCDFCNKRFNESSNLSKHRRIHTGQKPYKCPICCKRFTQSSNLNVHKRICKGREQVSSTIVQDPENVREVGKSLSDKITDVIDSSSLRQAHCEDEILETSSKDLNFSQKQIVPQKKIPEESKRVSENENLSKSLDSQPTEVSNSTHTNEVSLQNGPEPNYQKADDIMLDNERKTLRQLDKITNCTKSPVHCKDSSKGSPSSPNNEDIFISQEKFLQNIELDIHNHHDAMEDNLQLSSANTRSVDRSALEETDQTVLFTSPTTINNKNGANKNSQIQRENDVEKTDIQDLDVRIMDQSISDNHTESDVNRKTYPELPSSRNDPKINRLTSEQCLPDHNKDMNKFLTKELHNLPTLSADKNCGHSNLDQPAILNPEQLSDQQTELIQLQTEDHDHQKSPRLIFVGEPIVKQEDVFSCRGADIELVQLPSQHSDVMNSINSAINGILETEEITSSGDQSSLFQNMAPDWFKIEPVYHTPESSDLNSVSSSNKSDLILINSDVDQINDIDDEADDDDVIIMDSLENYKPVKAKINFSEEMNKLNKSSYSAVSKTHPLSSLANTISFQPLVKTEPSNQLESANNSKNITDGFLIRTTKPTDFSNCDSEKIMHSYPSDDFSVQDCHVSDRSLLYSDPLVPLQVNYPQQQSNTNNLVDKNDDDIAIIDIKSTSPGKGNKDSNILLFNSNYTPAYFNKSCNVSPAACKGNNMDMYSEGAVMKQTENRLEHMQESFDYLVPHISDQLNDDNGRVIEVPGESKQRDIAANQNSMYMCKFCQERFPTSSSLVNHSCPNTGEDFNNVNMQKNGVHHAGNYEMDTQVATVDLNKWGGEYSFNTESHENMPIPGNENSIVASQDDGQLLSVNKEKILENSKPKNIFHTSTHKYENQLPEFSPQQLQVTLNNYGCFPVDRYNNVFDSSFPGDNQPSSGNRSFLDNSFTNNNKINNNSNSAVDISTILSSSESLPSNNTLSSSIKTLPLNKMSLSGLPSQDPDFLPVVNKQSSFSRNDYLYTHINNYHPQNGISNHTDSNVLLKDFSTELSSDQTSKYSPSTPSHHTSVSISSVSPSTSSTNFINVLDPAISMSLVPCQYCDKMLNLNELSRHTCSGATQPNNRYACTFCDKTLCDASSLSKHLRIHTGHKPYSCEFCGKAFTQSSNLNVHKRVCKDKDYPPPTT